MHRYLALFIFFLTGLVAHRATGFACRLAAGLAFSAAGMRACLDTGFLNGLDMLHNSPPKNSLLQSMRPCALLFTFRLQAARYRAQ